MWIATPKKNPSNHGQSIRVQLPYKFRILATMSAVIHYSLSLSLSRTKKLAALFAGKSASSFTDSESQQSSNLP